MPGPSSFVCTPCWQEGLRVEALVKHPHDRFFHTEEWVRADGKQRLARVSIETVCRRHAQEQAETSRRLHRAD